MAAVYEMRSRTSSEVGVIDLLARRELSEQARSGRATRARHRFAGRALIVLGLVGGTGIGLSAFYSDLLLVHESFGLEGLTLSLLLPPLSFLSIPWYALFSRGDAGPLLLGYGAPLAGWLLAGVGQKLRGVPAPVVRPAVPDADVGAANPKVIAFRPRAAGTPSMRRARSRSTARHSRRPTPASAHQGRTQS